MQGLPLKHKSRLLRRHSRVYPFRLRGHGEGNAELLHKQYFLHRKKILNFFIDVFPEDKVSRRFKRWLFSPFLRTVLWFAVDVFYCAIKVNKKNWKYVKDETGKGQLHQLLECLWCAVSTPSMPENYYKFEWFNESNRIRRKDYLHRYEMKTVLYTLLYKPDEIKQAPLLSDKAKFHCWASQHGIPVPGLLAEIKGGEIVIQERSGVTQFGADCFVKPTVEKGGKNSMLLECLPGKNRYQNFVTGNQGSFRELMSPLLNDSLENGTHYLVQSRLKNHHDLSMLSSQAAATARIISILDEADQPEIVEAHFRIPASEHDHVDNMHAGGLSCVVDIQTGTLGKASDYGLQGSNNFYACHPLTNALIEGTGLPHWVKTLELIRSAHERARPIKLVGWDVCITDDGPVIVEANLQPCTDGLQRRHRSPLSGTRFAELVGFHVRNTVESGHWENYIPSSELVLLANEN